MNMRQELLLLPGLLLVCGAASKEDIEPLNLAVKDGTTLEGKRMTFAVVGNLAPPSRGQSGAEERNALLEDLRLNAQVGGFSFLVHTGDMVPRSRASNWRAASEILSSLPGPDGEPLPIVPVVGDGEHKGDRLLKGYGAMFPGVGATIGYQRVASWYHFDVDLADATWRFLVLDTNRRSLGPRWKEQLHWIPKVVEGDDYDHLLIFLHHPLLTLADGHLPNRHGAAGELIETIDEHVGILKIRAVFSGDPAVSEVFLPRGPYDALHVGAGGGSAAMNHLERWGNAPEAGIQALMLEPFYDRAVLRSFDDVCRDREFPEAVVDAARAEGEWSDFPGRFDAGWFPLRGYWKGAIQGHQLQVTFRLQGSDGVFKDIYQVDFAAEQGWRTGS